MIHCGGCGGALFSRPRDNTAQAGAGDDGTMGRTFADLGEAQAGGRPSMTTSVRGELAEGRYRSIGVEFEREIDRLLAVVDAGIKQSILLHPDPRGFWEGGRLPTAAGSGS